MSGFDTIFRKYYQQLFLYAMKFVDSEDDAHNIVQDIFTAVFEKRIFEQPESYLKPYLFNSIRNSCINFLKHEKVVNRHFVKAVRELKEMELKYFESSEKSLIEKETYKKIHAAIEELTEEQREVIHLSRFEGLKNKEIAEKLNVPVRTVETRIFRALAALRKKLTTQTFFVLLHSWSGLNNAPESK
jgi:RNA polymerase sigma-70 factor, ECF subfamily